MEKNIRKPFLKDLKRVVIKVGSGVLTAEDSLNIEVIDNLVSGICELRQKGIEVILISSGAIAAGLKKIGLKKRPDSVSQQQAVAAVGQSSLIMAYEKSFGTYNQKVAQILVTRDDLSNRRRYLNARNTLFTLLGWEILPIINENDTVVIDEIKFGDNDNLSAMISNLIKTDLLIILTDIDGFCDKDPCVNEDAKIIRVIEKFDQKLLKRAGSIPGFLGTGGMASKVKAAKKVALAGIPTIIANGLKAGILKKIISAKDEGTFFLPKKIPLNQRDHWIAFTKAVKGEIAIDQGATHAILDQGKSLLPSGVVGVKGRFSKGASIRLFDEKHNYVGIGLVNYGSEEIKRIMGVNTSKINTVLGFKHDDEIIHRNNLIISKKMD